MKLYDSELKVLNVLWENGDMNAKEIAEILKNQVGWSKTTTYTVIKKCIEKDALSRSEPGFLCHAKVTHDEVRAYETEELISKMYNGSADMLLASLLSSDKLSKKEIEKLKLMVNQLN